MNDSEKIKIIKECYEEFYNDNDITRYDVFDSIETIIFEW